jgi:two-component system sensor histidine kinase DegS
VSLKLEFRDDRLSVSVVDDGMGFDVEAALKPKSESFGIIGMRERVELFQGNLQFNSTIGKGTKVYFQLPILIAE